MFWKNTGLLCIVLAALSIVGYAQTQKPRSTNLQSSSGYLGVGVQDLPSDMAKTLGLKDRAGVLVTSVTEGQPGARAGVRKNDVILEFDGQKYDSGEKLTDSILSKAPGTKVNLIVFRGGTRQTLVATLGARPFGLPLQLMQQPGIAEPGPMPPDIAQMMAAAVAATATPRAGFEGFDLESQLSEFFGVREGVLVTQVYEKTPAERAGLKAGDVVIKVNGMPVASAREISGIVRQLNKKLIAFTVVRNKKEMTLNVELAWNRSDSSERGDVN